VLGIVVLDFCVGYLSHRSMHMLPLMWPIWILGLPAAAVMIQRLLQASNGVIEHANIRLAPAIDRWLSSRNTIAPASSIGSTVFTKVAHVTAEGRGLASPLRSGPLRRMMVPFRWRVPSAGQRFTSICQS
jgi:hypothetical protein